MKHAFQLASASVAALFAVSANAGTVTTFNIDFEGGTVGSAPTAAASVGSWSVGSGESAIATAGGNKYLEVDAPTNSATSFEPTATGTSKIAMDVKFVGASEEPTTGIDKSTTQAALYLRRGVSTTNLYLSVAGGDFVDTGLSVVEDDWYRVEIKFEYGTRTGITVSNLTTHAHDSYTTNVVADATGVQGVDFFGSGKVDNFIGQYAEYDAPIPMYPSTTTEGDATNTTATISNGYLNPNFAATYGGDAIKFIKVTGTINGVEATRTLRVVGDNQNIAVQAAGFTSISRVVAYYGNDVSAVSSGDATTTPAVTTTGGTTKITGSVTATAKSGVYYGLVVDGSVSVDALKLDGSTLSPSTPVAPQDHGKALTYEISPSSANYGVKKFKIVASDDPVSAQ